MLLLHIYKTCLEAQPLSEISLVKLHYVQMYSIPLFQEYVEKESQFEFQSDRIRNRSTYGAISNIKTNKKIKMLI